MFNDGAGKLNNGRGQVVGFVVALLLFAGMIMPAMIGDSFADSEPSPKGWDFTLPDGAVALTFDKSEFTSPIKPSDPPHIALEYIYWVPTDKAHGTLYLLVGKDSVCTREHIEYTDASVSLGDSDRITSKIDDPLDDKHYVLTFKDCAKNRLPGLFNFKFTAAAEKIHTPDKNHSIDGTGALTGIKVDFAIGGTSETCDGEPHSITIDTSDLPLGTTVRYAVGDTEPDTDKDYNLDEAPTRTEAGVTTVWALASNGYYQAYASGTIEILPAPEVPAAEVKDLPIPEAVTEAEPPVTYESAEDVTPQPVLILPKDDRSGIGSGNKPEIPVKPTICPPATEDGTVNTDKTAPKAKAITKAVASPKSAALSGTKVLPGATLPVAKVAPADNTAGSVIPDLEAPLSASSSESYAFFNFILAMLTALISVLLLITYFTRRIQFADEKGEDVRRHGALRLLSLLVTAAAFVMFFTNEDMSKPMLLMDGKTKLYLVILAVQVGLAFLSRKRYVSAGEV